MILDRRPSGFIVADAVLGMAIVVVLGGVAAVAIVGRAKAGHRLENIRAAAAEAELVLSEANAGQSTNIPHASEQVRLEFPPGGAQVPGYAWVRVTVTRGGESVSLVGLGKKAHG